MCHTTTLLREHFPADVSTPMSALVESYIVDKTWCPADMATAGHWELTLEAADNGGLDSALYGACRGDSMVLVNELHEKGGDVNFGFLGACCGANIDAAQLMLAKGATLKKAARAGNLIEAAAKFGNSLPMVRWLERKWAEAGDPLDERDLRFVLVGGCYNGNMALVNYAIERGCTNYDEGLYAAAQDGDKGVILLMLRLGAHPNFGLAGACAEGKLELAARMVQELGAEDFNAALRAAARKGQMEAVKYALALGATDVNGAFRACYHQDCWNRETVRVLKWLVANGANACSLCCQDTAFHIADMSKFAERDV